MTVVDETTTSPYTPVPKVAAAGIAGAAAVILVWLAGLAGINVPEEVAAAVTAVLSFGAGYLKPSK